MQYKEKEILEIVWIDSVHCNGWKSKEDFINNSNEKWIRHTTIGYFLMQTKEAITVMQSYGIDSGEQYNTDSRMSIPIVAIKKIRRR